MVEGNVVVVKRGKVRIDEFGCRRNDEAFLDVGVRVQNRIPFRVQEGG